MTQAAAFARSTWLQYVALFQWATPLGYLAYKVFLPVCQIVFFVQLGVFATGPANALYFALGNSLQLTANSGIFGVIGTVANERHLDTLLAKRVSLLPCFAQAPHTRKPAQVRVQPSPPKFPVLRLAALRSFDSLARLRISPRPHHETMTAVRRTRELPAAQ